MAERLEKDLYSFIEQQYGTLEFTPDIQAPETAQNISKELYQISDFGSNIAGINEEDFSFKDLYENSGLPIDITGLDINPALKNIVAPGSAQAQGTVGFKDPKDTWPTHHRENESDWHRFTGREPDKQKDAEIDSNKSVPIKEQKEYKESHIETRNDARVGVITKVKTATGTTWEEPESDKKTKYGDNYVIATHGGVILELDSTEGSQAFRIAHPSNSYMEINSKGEFIQKTFSSRFDIIAKDHKTFINDNRWTSVNMNDDLRIAGEQCIVIDKNKIEINQSDSSLTIFKSYVRNVGNNDALIVGQSQKITIMQNQDIEIMMAKNENIGMTYNLNALVSLNATTGAKIDFKTGVFQVKAGIIFLNC